LTIRDVRSRNSCDPIGNRVFNVASAAVLLLLLGPLLVFIALAIRWGSPGPALERRLSINRDGARFYQLNFRVTEYDDSVQVWAKNMTGVGWFLLYTRIVSLPQLINVLLGDISLSEIEDCSSF